MQVSAIGSAVQVSTNRPQGMIATGETKPELLSRFELASQILGIASSSAVSPRDREVTEVTTGRTGSFRAAPVDATGRTAAKAAGKTVAAVLDGLDAAASRAVPLKPGQAVRGLAQWATFGDVQRAVRSYAAELAAAEPAAKAATDVVRTEAVAAGAAPTTPGTLPRTVSDALPAPRIPGVAPTADADVTLRPQRPGAAAPAGQGKAEQAEAEQSEAKRGKAGHDKAGRHRAEHPHLHPGHTGPGRPAGPHDHGLPEAGPHGPHRTGDRDVPGPGKPEGKAAHDVRDAKLPAGPGGAPAGKPAALPAPAGKPVTETPATEKPAAPRPAPDTKPDPRVVAAQPPKAEASKGASAVKPAAEAKTAQPVPAPQAAKGGPEKTAPEKAPAAVSAAVRSYKAQ